MNIYLAPMEGITGYIYRNAFKRHFGGVSRYFTPFIVGNKCASMKAKELRDILPENNQDMDIVPQILTSNAEEFIATAARIQTLGYDEVNINLGCPSGTVVSKGRGAGFLAYPSRIDEFLEEIFAHTHMKISIKTRLGIESVAEFEDILNVYRKYPLSELIIHPRTQKEMYTGYAHRDIFLESVRMLDTSFPIGYNGDIFKVDDYKRAVDGFDKTVTSVMLGRGIIANPALADLIVGGKETTPSNVKTFLDELYEDYRQIMSCDKDTLFRMKELWSYMIWLFPDETSGKYIKKIRKSQTKAEYMAAVEEIFASCRFDCASGLFGNR